VPWNYPLYLAVGPMVAALAAGNRVMVKMSEATPAVSAAEFQALLQPTPSDPTKWCIVTGGPDVAAQFSALPFDHLLFTGSTNGRSPGDAQRGREPHAGDAGARRQVARR
jgi:coniferyl-aldehyde dehydrogenase